MRPNQRTQLVKLLQLLATAVIHLLPCLSWHMEWVLLYRNVVEHEEEHVSQLPSLAMYPNHL